MDHKSLNAHRFAKKRESESQETISLRNRIANMANTLPTYEGYSDPVMKLQNKRLTQYKVDPQVYSRFHKPLPKPKATSVKVAYTKTPRV
jgi:hypothetical protein